MVEAFKALSNKNRLAIFEQIRMGCCRAQINGEKRLAVCAVAEAVNIVPSTVSSCHVKELIYVLANLWIPLLFMISLMRSLRLTWGPVLAAPPTLHLPPLVLHCGV